jgi:regulatory protein
MEDSPLYKKAMRKALHFLSYRGRSISEMRLKLGEEGYGGPLVKKIIDRLVELGYLNDGNFAEYRARSLAVNRLWSNRRIENDLRLRGIPETLVAQAIEKAREETSEKKAIAKLIEKKLGGKRGIGLSFEENGKLAQSLARRGFPVGLVFEVLNSEEKRIDDRQRDQREIS